MSSPTTSLRARIMLCAALGMAVVLVVGTPRIVDAQGLVTVALPRLLRKIGDLQPAELALVEEAVKRWLGL